MSCCFVRRKCRIEKKRILLFGSAKKGVSVRNSLASYLGEESNRNITEGELRGLFSKLLTFEPWGTKLTTSSPKQSFQS